MLSNWKMNWKKSIREIKSEKFKTELYTPRSRSNAKFKLCMRDRSRTVASSRLVLLAVDGLGEQEDLLSIKRTSLSKKMLWSNCRELSSKVLNIHTLYEWMKIFPYGLRWMNDQIKWTKPHSCTWSFRYVSPFLRVIPSISVEHR